MVYINLCDSGLSIFDVRATIFIETDITLNDLGAIQQRAVEWPPIEGADDPKLTGQLQ